jgi:peroxin-6
MVQVTEQDFVRALHELIPSVSAAELDHYKSVRARFEKKEDEEEKVEAPMPKASKGKGKGKARVQ